MLLLLSGAALALRGKQEFSQWSREEIEREVAEFVSFYSSSPIWWLSSLFGALFAATVGASGGVIFDFIALLIFVGPAAGYYSYYRPFGFKCTYVPMESEWGQNECRPVGGKYTLSLKMEPGKNIHDYRLDIHLPPQISFGSEDLETSSLDKERSILYGVSGSSKSSYWEYLYLEQNGSIPPSGEWVLLKSRGSGETIEAVRLLPSGE